MFEIITVHKGNSRPYSPCSAGAHNAVGGKRISCMLFAGDETLSTSLRTLTAIELHLYSDEYACQINSMLDQVCRHPDAVLARSTYESTFFSDSGLEVLTSNCGLSKAIAREAEETLKLGSWSVMLHLLALATVTKREIWSLYPEANWAIRPLFHRCVLPRRCEDDHQMEALYILWSRDGNIDNTPGATYTPNHFVPLTKGEQDPFDEEIPMDLINKLEEAITKSGGASAKTEKEEYREEVKAKEELREEVQIENDKYKEEVKIEKEEFREEAKTEKEDYEEEVKTEKEEYRKEAKAEKEEYREGVKAEEEEYKKEVKIEKEEFREEAKTEKEEYEEEVKREKEEYREEVMNDLHLTTSDDHMSANTLDILSSTRNVLYPDHDDDVEFMGQSSDFETADDQPLQQLLGSQVLSEFDTDDNMPLTVLLHSTPKRQNLEKEEPPSKRKVKQKGKPTKRKKDGPRRTGLAHEKLSANEDSLNGDEFSDAEPCFSDDSDLDLDSMSSSSDESDADNNDDIQWVKKAIPMRPEHFGGPSPGGKLSLPPDAKARDYFMQMLPPDLWRTIGSSSNKYVPIYQAKRRKLPGVSDTWTDDDYKPISEEDIKAYVGIRMIAALSPKSSMPDFWSTDPALGNEYIKNTMSRRRFMNITRYLHINNPAEDPARIHNRKERAEKMAADPLYKVSPLLTPLRANLKRYYNLHQQVSLDEAMVKCHGQHWGIVGAPNKPAKRGFKVWTLADGISGYIYDFEVYFRKQREVGLTQRVVENLTEEIQGKHHIVFVDKYYTSIPLAKSLLRRKTYLCGSFNTSRRHWPADLKPDKRKPKRDDPVRNLKRGESMARQSKKGDIVACVWKDSSTVYNLSTCYDGIPNARHDTIDRRVRDNKTGTWSKTSYSCPPSIIEYNKYMGGVDRHDHIRSSYTLQRSCPKWWTYFAWFGLDVALVNAYLLYKENFSKATHKKFQLEVGTKVACEMCVII